MDYTIAISDILDLKMTRTVKFPTERIWVHLFLLYKSLLPQGL